MRDLDGHVRRLAHRLGVDFYGVADLAPAREAIREQGGGALASFPRAISIGIALMHAIVDQLPDVDRAVAYIYRNHAYDVVNRRLDDTTSRLSSFLQRQGYRTLPIGASRTVDEDDLRGVFSHKLAARLAGLGWIGKSCLLVTPQVGPRVRWATILVDAPLMPTGGPMPDRCGDCRACVDICPPRAFTGAPFRPEEPREVRYDAHACLAYQRERQKALGLSVCGLCLYVCPYGQQAAKRLK